MSQEISISTWNIYNDRGAINTEKETSICINADRIEIGKPLPITEEGRQMLFLNEIPTVTYFDGEALDIEYHNTNYQLHVHDTKTIESITCSNNYVIKTKEIRIQLNEYSFIQNTNYRGMYLHRSYNSLIENALPAAAKDDKEAIKYLMWCVNNNENLFILTRKTIDFIEKNCKKENRYAYYVSARCHYILRREENYNKLMIDRVKSAYYARIPEAAVLMAEMYRLGEFGIADFTKFKKYLLEGLENNCDYAAQIMTTRLIYGCYSIQADKEKAEKAIKDVLESDNDDINPKWYFLMGEYTRTFVSLSAAKPYYEKAIENGFYTAYSYLALASACNENYETIDKTLYNNILQKGIEKRNGKSYLYMAIDYINEYENQTEYFKQWIYSKKIEELLKQAYDLGEGIAATEYGKIYYYGEYYKPEDDEKAFEWFAKGALAGDYAGYEMMYEMINKHYIDKDERFTDMVALNGTRLGSKLLLPKTVMAYTYGRLTEFASEIEQYYCPIFDEEQQTENTDETDGISDLQTNIDGEIINEKERDDESCEETENDDIETDDDGRYDAWA